jgi:acyl-CoA synthetase (NDP forming)
MGRRPGSSAALDQAGTPRALLHPGSVALIGASARDGFAARTLENLVGFGFPGRIYPVNPRYAELAGLRCYPSIGAIGEPVDLALIAVPAVAVPAVIEECASAGVAAASAFSSGFAELGPEGLLLQQRMTATAARTGMRILGPNCMGHFYQPASLVASFTSALRSGLLPGSGVAYLGQSGAIGGAVMGMLAEHGHGLSAWFSTGNEADLTTAEIAAALVEDDTVRIVAAYLENVPDGAAWQQLTRRIVELGKRLVVLRSGRSAAGRRAAASHTGAMVRSDAAFGLLNADRGVIEVDDVEELVDTVELLVADRRPAGPAVAVLTSSGGTGGLLADQLESAGLVLAELKPHTQAAIARLIPAYGSVANPVDVTAQLFTQDMDAFVQACRPVLDDDGVDVLTVISTVVGPGATAIAEGIVCLCQDSTKPIGVVLITPAGATGDARRVLHHAGVPVATSMPAYVKLLRNALVRPRGTARAALTQSELTRSESAGQSSVLGGALVAELFGADAAETITEAPGARVLDAVGIPRPRGVLVTTETEADLAVRDLAPPFVLKIQSPQIAHKSDIGGVRVGIRRQDAIQVYREVRAAGERVSGARVDGVLVQEMASAGTELILGVRGARDGYPPVLAVGFGGVLTELYADVVSILAPVDPDQVRVLLRRLRGWPLLNGYRGAPPAALDAVVAAVVALGRVAVELGDRLDELEINPLVVNERGATAVDLVIRPRSRGKDTVCASRQPR